MESRTEEKKDRFRFDKLEARIAPGAAAFGLNNAVAHLDTAIANAPPEVVQHVLDTIETHNPQVC